MTTETMTDIVEYAPVSADVLERLWPEPGTRPRTAWTHRRCGLVVTDQFEHDPKFGRFPCPNRRASTPFHPAIIDVGTEKKENIMTKNQHGPTLAQRFISAAAGGPPSTSQRINMVDNTDAIRRAGERLERNTEPSREQSLALTHLEEALFWANKAVMLHDLSLVELASSAKPALSDLEPVMPHDDERGHD